MAHHAGHDQLQDKTERKDLGVHPAFGLSIRPARYARGLHPRLGQFHVPDRPDRKCRNRSDEYVEQFHV
jgi:hypothetical protein